MIINFHNIYLYLHFAVLAFVAWTVFQADHLGFDWIRGKTRTLDGSKVSKLHRATWIGLAGMIMTGLLLFWPMREFLLTQPPFYVKMAFVAALLINGAVIGRLQKVATSKAYSELTAKEKLPLIISGAVSTVSWTGAAVVAFFLIPD